MLNVRQQLTVDLSSCFNISQKDVEDYDKIIKEPDVHYSMRNFIDQNKKETVIKKLLKDFNPEADEYDLRLFNQILGY